MITTLVIICIVLNVLTIGLLFLLYKTIGKVGEDQHLIRKVLADIWTKHKTTDDALLKYIESYNKICDEQPAAKLGEQLLKLTTTVDGLRETYDGFYEVIKNTGKHIDYNLCDISSMLADVWWATDFDTDGLEFSDELDGTEIQEIDSLFNDIDTGLDGVESDLINRWGDRYLIKNFLSPIRSKVESMREKFDGLRSDDEDDKGSSEERGEVSGVLEGAPEEGLDGETDSLEPWDEYDEVQAAPEDGEDDGEAGSLEY